MSRPDLQRMLRELAALGRLAATEGGKPLRVLVGVELLGEILAQGYDRRAAYAYVISPSLEPCEWAPVYEATR